MASISRAEWKVCGDLDWCQHGHQIEVMPTFAEFLCILVFTGRNRCRIISPLNSVRVYVFVDKWCMCSLFFSFEIRVDWITFGGRVEILWDNLVKYRLLRLNSPYVSVLMWYKASRPSVLSVKTRISHWQGWFTYHGCNLLPRLWPMSVFAVKDSKED
jgi:hypothetical protein